MSGFKINRVVVLGNDVEPAEVTFKSGLNVVAGPTSTGKSWLYSCLNYMLGGSAPPKDIIQARPYNQCYIELEDHLKNIYILNRSFNGGDIDLFNCSYDDVLNTKKSKLKISSNSKKETSISKFLLHLSGIDDVFIVDDAQGSKKQLQFSTAKMLFLVDENTIITTESPILLGKYPNATVATSLLNFFVSGKGEAYAEKLPNTKILKAGHNGRVEMLNDLILSVENELAAFPRVEIDEIDNQISSTRQTLNDYLYQLSDLDKSRQEISSDILISQSELSGLHELLARFNLLSKHYINDIRRLDFIIEGAYLFDELQFVDCPICQSPIENHHLREVCERSATSIEAIQIACAKEKVKINVQLSDLKKALQTVEADRSLLDNKITNLTTRHHETISLISQGITPRITHFRNEMDVLSNQRTQAIERTLLQKRLEQLIELKTGLVHEKQPSKILSEDAKIDSEGLSNFCREIETILIDWGVDETEAISPVSFNASPSVLDLKLNNEARGNTAKGVRAITYSAFILGLMSHCKKNNLPHSRLVILDSPLTTFTKGNQRAQTPKEDLPSNIQDRVFRGIATKNKLDQVIVFENKLPPLDLKDEVHLIEFTRDETLGRYGFFPIV